MAKSTAQISTQLIGTCLQSALSRDLSVENQIQILASCSTCYYQNWNISNEQNINQMKLLSGQGISEQWITSIVLHTSVYILSLCLGKHPAITAQYMLRM